jgi:DNA-binding transcriptional regulator YiaG
LESDARENKREIVRLQKKIDSIPFGCEIRAMREAAGLTQIEAGQIFGGGPTAFSKYETDDLVPNDSMVNLLKLAIQDSSIVTRLRMLKGVHVSFGVIGELSEPSNDYGVDRLWEEFDNSSGLDVVALEVMRVGSGFFDGEQRWTQ